MSLSFLDSTGKSDTQFGVGESIADELIKWGNEVNDKLKKSLVANTSSGTSQNLLESLVVLPIELGESKFTLKFQAEDYWKFINSGVGGAGGKKKDGSAWVNKAPNSLFHFKSKKPPVNFSSLSGGSLRQWSYNKGLNEYAVRESIFRRGIKPTYFWDEVINKKLVDDLVKRLEKAGAREVEIILSKDFK